MMASTTISGWGCALPATRITNAMLATTLDTSDEWIRERTGINERRWAENGETTGFLATSAAEQAIKHAGLATSDIDAVVIATCTPETPLPSTAATVAARLGLQAGGFDINSACAGFVSALATAQGLLTAGIAAHVLVIGADTMSRVTNQRDRNTAVLFGDGAGALIVSRAPTAQPGGLVASDLVNDPNGFGLLSIPGGGAAQPASAATVAAGLHTITMDGRELFRQAVRAASTSIARTLARAQLTPHDIDLFIPHQANARITDAIRTRSGFAENQTVSNIERLGNTSAASIPLAICEAAKSGRLADGNRIVLCGFGAGLSVATLIWNWQSTKGRTR